MISFSYQVKKETALLDIEGQDEALSELSAIIRASGEIQLAKHGKKIIVKTEILELCDKIDKMLMLLYGKKTSRQVSDELTFSKNQRYVFGSGNSVANYVPLENFLTMLEVCRNYKIGGNKND